jgi:hypothetical protein
MAQLFQLVAVAVAVEEVAQVVEQETDWLDLILIMRAYSETLRLVLRRANFNVANKQHKCQSKPKLLQEWRLQLLLELKLLKLHRLLNRKLQMQVQGRRQRRRQHFNRVWDQEVTLQVMDLKLREMRQLLRQQLQVKHFNLLVKEEGLIGSRLGKLRVKCLRAVQATLIYMVLMALSIIPIGTSALTLALSLTLPILRFALLILV